MSETVPPSTLADWLRTLPPPPDASAVVSPRTAAQDSVIRFACALWATAPDAALAPSQRAWILARLQKVDPVVPLSDRERQVIQPNLLAWIQVAHPAIVTIVARQFDNQE